MNSNKVRFNTNVEVDGDLLVTGTIHNAKLLQNTITGVEAAFNANTVTLNNSTPTRVHGVWLNVEKSASPIEIDFNMWGTFVHNAGGSFIAYVQLVRSRYDTGGDVLMTVPIYGSGMANDVWQGSIPIRYLDKPNANGNWHYYVQVYFNVSNMSTQQVTSRFGKLTELKTNNSNLGTGTGSGAGVGSGGGTSGGGGDTGGGSSGGGITDPGNPGGGGLEEPTLPQEP